MRQPRRIVLSERAQKDIDRLRAFIARESEASAQRAIERLIRGIDPLADLPELGMKVSGRLRQLILPYGKSAYIVRYRYTEDKVTIVRIWHGREKR